MTGADILRIERDLNISFWEFACRWADPKGEIARNYAPHFFFADEPQTPWVICLTQVQSEIFPTTSKCQFLKETPPDEQHPLGQAGCGIYHSRPSACRVFPLKLDTVEELPVISNINSCEREGSHDAYKLCPREWTPADVDPVDVGTDLATARYEMEFFHKIAAIWNQAVGPWSVFPDFIREVYSGRVVAQPQEQKPSETDSTQTIPIRKAA